MHADAQPDRGQRRTLQLERTRPRVAGPRERHHEAIALALFARPPTVMGGDDLPHRAIEPRDGGRHLLRLGLPQSCGALDVGQQQRHRSGRKLDHTQVAPVQRRVRLWFAHASQHAAPTYRKHQHNRVDCRPRCADLRHRTAPIYASGPTILRRRHRIVDSFRLQEATMTIHTTRRTPESPAALPQMHRSTPVVPLDREAALAAVNAAAARLTALLRGTDDIGRPAAGTDWTIAETAAHVSVGLTGLSAAIAWDPQALTPERYLDADFPTRLAASNAATNAMVDHTDAGWVAEAITAGAQRFLELAAAADPQMECETPWYGLGRTRTPDCLTALALGELTVHAYDIAAGTGRPWPISAEHAKLIAGTVCPEMWPLAVRPEAGRPAPMTYEGPLRGSRPLCVIRVADGTAGVRAAGGPG